MGNKHARVVQGVPWKGAQNCETRNVQGCRDYRRGPLPCPVSLDQHRSAHSGSLLCTYLLSYCDQALQRPLLASQDGRIRVFDSKFACAAWKFAAANAKRRTSVWLEVDTIGSVYSKLLASMCLQS